MSGEMLISLIGLVAVILGIIGGVIVRDRQVIKTITDGDKELHERINQSHKDIARDYVRRDDLNGHIATIENSVNQMREEQRETNRRIDSLLTALSKTKE